MTETAPPFFTRYGFARTGDPAMPLAIEPYPEVCVGAALRATIIASAIDLVGGLLTREIAGVDALMTSDLSLRIPQPGIPSRLLVHAERIRAGRRLVTSSVRIEAEGSKSAGDFAYGETTFVRVPRTPEEAPPLEMLQTPSLIERNPLTIPLADEVGIERDPGLSGRVRLDLRPALLNPEGIMQGALVALVIESAGLALADGTQPQGTARASDAQATPMDPTAPRHAVCGLDLRYLSANSVGPIIGQAHWIGPPAARMIRVELRDQGRDDRLTASALMQVIPMPHAPLAAEA